MRPSAAPLSYRRSPSGGALVMGPALAVAGDRRVPGRRLDHHWSGGPQGSLGWRTVGLVLALLLTAALVAPEGAADQAAICQRHNGVEACRVW